MFMWAALKIILAGGAYALSTDLDMRFNLNKRLKVILLIVAILLAGWGLLDLLTLTGII